MGDLSNTVIDGDPYDIHEGGGGGAGHEYDIVQNSALDETTLQEDGVNKTTLPLLAAFVGTHNEWNQLSAAEQARYRIINYTDDGSHNDIAYMLNIIYPVGSVIHSTTLDTMQKVVAQFGGTTWIQHTGYMLRGATSSVTANSAVADGGSDTVTPSGTNTGGAVQSHTLIENEIPAHKHSIGFLNEGRSTASPITWTHSLPYTTTDSSTVSMWGSTTNKGGGQGHSHGFTQPTFTGNAQSNLPLYKNVYIWERTA